MAETKKTLSTALNELTQQTTLAEADRIATITAGGKAQSATLANVRKSIQNGNEFVVNMGNYSTWSAFEAALLNLTDQGLYFGTLNGVGVAIKVMLLGVADKHYLYEISGGIEFNKTKYPTIEMKTSDHWRVFVRETRNKTWQTKWSVEGGHYDIGTFSTSAQAETEAALPYIGGCESITTIRYNVNPGTGDEHSTGNGTIFQSVQDNICMQYIFWGSHISYRSIRFTDNNRTQVADNGKGNWVQFL